MTLAIAPRPLPREHTMSCMFSCFAGEGVEDARVIRPTDRGEGNEDFFSRLRRPCENSSPVSIYTPADFQIFAKEKVLLSWNPEIVK